MLKSDRVILHFDPWAVLDSLSLASAMQQLGATRALAKIWLHALQDSRSRCTILGVAFKECGVWRNIDCQNARRFRVKDQAGLPAWLSSIKISIHPLK